MSSPINEIEDRSLILYLLGTLPDAEAERLDALSVSDDAIAARLCDAENDLVDAYVRGDLQGEYAEGFHSRYLTTPHRRRKVEIAHSLLQLVRGLDETTPVPAKVSRRVATPMSRHLALAAGILLFVAAGVVLDDVRVRRSLSEEHASLTELSSRTSASIQDLVAERARTNALTAETKRLQGMIGELHPPDAASQSAKSHPVRSASFLILPPRKGNGAPPVLAVPTDAKQLEIRLVLDDDEFQHYRVSLKSRHSSTLLWQSPVLNAERHDGSSELKLVLPAAFFKGGVYNLEVSGLPPGHEEPVTNYAFIEESTTVVAH